MAVEKGQKYKANSLGFEYTILSDPFETPLGEKRVSYWDHTTGKIQHMDPSSFERGAYHLFVEPKFKVGDRVKVKYCDYELSIVGVTSEQEPDGEFWYVLKYPEGFFSPYEESDLKASS